MNRAIATIHKLEKKKNVNIVQFVKFRNPKKQHTEKMLNGVDITFKLPAKWRDCLQTKANMHTNGNLSAYLRKIIRDDLKYKKGEQTK